MTPDSKYTHKEPLLFFNYHEFLVHDYTPVDQQTDEINTQKQALVINHFPNIYAPLDSITYNQTRVIRIPRSFDNIDYPDLIPQFSTYIPGNEPSGIIKNGQKEFEINGEWEGNKFGSTSLTPLSNIIEPSALVSIIENINKIIYIAYDPYNPMNFINGVLDVLSGSLYSTIFNRFLHDKRGIRDLERYIDEVNSKNDQFRIILPKLTGFLSLDLVITFP